MTLEDFISTMKAGTMEGFLIEIRDQEDYMQFLCPPDAKVLDPYRQNHVRYWFIPSLSSIKADIVVSIWEGNVCEDCEIRPEDEVTGWTRKTK